MTGTGEEKNKVNSSRTSTRMDNNLDPFRSFESMEFLPGTQSFVHLDDIAARYTEKPGCTYLNRTITYRTLWTTLRVF